MCSVLFHNTQHFDQGFTETRHFLVGAHAYAHPAVRADGADEHTTLEPVSYTHLDVYKRQEVNIEGVQTGPEDLNGDATLTVLLTCTNIGKKTMYPHAVADLMVMQNGIELAPAFTSNEDSDRTEFSGAEMKPKKSSQTTSSFVLTDTNSPVVVQLMNYSQHNVVRAAFSFDEVDIEGSLKHIRCV